MIAGTVCSGIGAPEVAMPQWQYAFQSEIEAFPRAVLAHRHGAQDARRSRKAGPALWGDFTAMRVRHLRRLGIPLPQWLIAGTPCQAFSLAGLRQSLADDRGNLTLEFVRLVHSIRRAGTLRGFTWENVPGVLTTKDNAFGCFLAAVVGADDPLCPPEGHRWPDAGMVAGPWARLAWRLLDAQYFGLAQRRRRVFVVASFGDGPDPAAVLFERQGGSGNFPPCRAAGQGFAHETVPSLTASGRGVERTGESRGQDPVVAVPFNLRGRDEGAQAEIDPDNLAALRAASGGSSRSYVAFSCKDYAQDATEDCSPTLRSMAGAPGQANGGGQIAVAALPFDEAETWAVRRLTPRECERLQGFPDDFTLVPYRGKPAADGPRYKALGNSMAVPVMRWIGERIAAVEAMAMPERDVA